MNKLIIKFSILIAVLIILQGCSSTQSFNTNNNIIDPFDVSPYSALTIPPIYYLSAPQKDAKETNNVIIKNREIVKNLIYKNDNSHENNTSSISSLSRGEKEILSLARATANFGNLKDEIDSQNTYVKKINESLIKKLLEE